MTSQAPAAADDNASDDAAVPQQPTPDEVNDQVSAPMPAGGEIGGREGLDPTRYGDWELRGRCIDF